MSNSKLLYSVFFFFFSFSFASSTISSYLNTSLTTHKCSAQETSALLLFKQNVSSLSYPNHSVLMNWNTSSDCCDWNGVTCDLSTGNIIGLDLSLGRLQGTITPNTSLFDIPHLQRLNLAYNDFYPSQIPREIGKFSKTLTHLNISACGFSGQVPTDFTLLHKLVSLDLSYNYDLSLETSVFVNLLRNSTSLEELSLRVVNISSSLPSYLNISSSLKLLNLGGIGLQGNLPSYIFNSESLEILDLSENSFTGQVPLEISLLPNLVSLDLSQNDNLRIQPRIFNNLLNNSTLLRDLRLPDVNISWVLPTDVINISSSLNYLDLHNCSLMGSLPESPPNLSHLTYLSLSSNKFNGTLPSWLFSLSSLEYLHLQDNTFSGMVPFESAALPSLVILSLAHNQLNGEIDQGPILKLTNLTDLELSFNNFRGEWELDSLLSSLTNLQNLDVSYSGLSVTSNNAYHRVNHNLKFLNLASCKIKVFPECLLSMKGLEDLDLSNNKINGSVPIWAGEIGNRLHYLNLSHNFITALPHFQWDELQYLYLQSNLIEGPFPPSICNMSYLRYLIMSNNSFGGVIPQCIGNISSFLQLIDMGNNRFQGTIPNVFENSVELNGLILNGNELEGEVPSSLSKCQNLKILDLGNNHFIGTFPSWLGDLPSLQALVLKSNSFHGRIVTSSVVEFPFLSLQVLDLSHNSFLGQLPQKYFQNFKAMKGDVKRSTKLEYLNIHGLYYSVVVGVKGHELPFSKISVDYVIVDLSNNMFEGEIPYIIGDLTSLIVLNLSHNSLTGQIPYTLGNLLEIESLDLSCNGLTGEIPQSLVDITNLEALNLSENDLEGRIPEGKQFSTFDMNSFLGNPKLCGIPLTKKCGEYPHESHFEDDEENGFTWRVVMFGYGCGTLFGLIMGYLMLLTGRPKWFNAIADVGGHIIHRRRTKRRYIYIGK